MFHRVFIYFDIILSIIFGAYFQLPGKYVIINHHFMFVFKGEKRKRYEDKTMDMRHSFGSDGERTDRLWRCKRFGINA